MNGIVCLMLIGVVTMKCINCSAEFEIKILEEGEKATEPLIEFCPMCAQIFYKKTDG